MRIFVPIAALAIALPVLHPTRSPAEPATERYAPLLGTWVTLDRHVAMGSLYQPVYGVR